MGIDDKIGFNTEKDKLIWTKIISFCSLATRIESTHVVKYYQTESEEYYVIEWIEAWNNGNIVNQFKGYDWKEVLKEISFSDSCYIYSQSVADKNNIEFVTMGRSVKIQTQGFKE